MWGGRVWGGWGSSEGSRGGAGEDSLEQQSSALALAQMLFLAQMRAKKVSQLRNCVLHHEGLYDGRLHFDFLAEDLTLCFFLGAVAIYCFMSQLHHSPCTKYEFARSHFLCTLIIRFQCKGWCDAVRLTLIAFLRPSSVAEDTYRVTP